MKIRSLIATLLLVAAATTVSAQRRLDYAWGVKGGLSVSQLYYQGDSYLNSRPSGHMGLFGEGYLPRGKMAVCVELLYGWEGGRDGAIGSYGAEGITFEGPYTLTLSYVQVPAYMKFLVLPHFTLDAGVQYGILTRATWKDSGTIKSRTRLPRTEYHSGVFSLLGGCTIDVRHVLVGMHFAYGLTSTLADDRVNNLCFRLSAGYRF